MAALLSPSSRYRGRFAPSPTGPLHFGSLIAAAGSYLQARVSEGDWLVRIEDLDTPRLQRGAVSQILDALEAFGFQWDGEILHQSARVGLYHEALESLRQRGLVYACGCSRREIADSTVARDSGRVYPGTCRNGLQPRRTARSYRVRTDGAVIGFSDLLQGRIEQQVEHAVGDFVLLRADGIVAYQLAVVIDDALQQITEVVRGADLLFSTPRQIYLQQLLGLPTPRYLHLPVAVNERGEKLSKQTGATALDTTKPGPELVAALRFLGQALPKEASDITVAELWKWALANWRPEGVPRRITASARYSA